MAPGFRPAPTGGGVGSGFRRGRRCWAVSMPRTWVPACAGKTVVVGSGHFFAADVGVGRFPRPAPGWPGLRRKDGGGGFRFSPRTSVLGGFHAPHLGPGLRRKDGSGLVVGSRPGFRRGRRGSNCLTSCWAVSTPRTWVPACAGKTGVVGCGFRRGRRCWAVSTPRTWVPACAERRTGVVGCGFCWGRRCGTSPAPGGPRSGSGMTGVGRGRRVW